LPVELAQLLLQSYRTAGRVIDPTESSEIKVSADKAKAESGPSGTLASQQAEASVNLEPRNQFPIGSGV
jgi:hypothetical protein